MNRRYQGAVHYESDGNLLSIGDDEGNLVICDLEELAMVMRRFARDELADALADELVKDHE